MELIGQLVESVIIPIIMYTAEGWNPSKAEHEKIENIFNKSLKTILGLPALTPMTILLWKQDLCQQSW